MELQDIPKLLKETLHLNGEYEGAHVGRHTDPARDIPVLCKILMRFYDWALSRDRSKSAQISMLKKRIVALEKEMRAFKARSKKEIPDA